MHRKVPAKVPYMTVKIYKGKIKLDISYNAFIILKSDIRARLSGYPNKKQKAHHNLLFLLSLTPRRSAAAFVKLGVH